MITTVCKISYGSQTVPPIVPAVQGDTGRAISFEIADFTPPAGATATYFILKPSGEAIYNSATITDNSILCELTAQSLAEAGENRMQVRVLHGEDIVTSFEVILMVRTFLGDDAMESGTEMNIFDQAVEQATEQFQENAEQIVAEVIESIPADYTELTEEVDELNERLDVTEITDTTLSSSDLENGALDANGMNAGSMLYRVRTSNYIELPENGDVYVNVASDENVYFTAWYYTVNDFATSKIGMEDWRKSGKLNVISNAKYVRFVFSINKSTDQISPSDIDSVTISHIESALDYVVKITQQTLTDEQKAQARANIGAISDEEGLLANFTINNGYICQVGGA